jgi:hypothetical protein
LRTRILTSPALYRKGISPGEGDLERLQAALEREPVEREPHRGGRFAVLRADVDRMVAYLAGPDLDLGIEILHVGTSIRQP